MLEGFDIIAFTYADWYASKSTPQHLARLLAENNRVLFVDVPHSFLYFLKGRDPLGAGQWQGTNLQEVQPNLFVYDPPHRFLPVGGLPYVASKATVRLNGWLIARQVRAAVRELGFRKPILWSFSPLHGGAVPHLDYELMIHDICEEWVNFLTRRSDKAVIQWMDRRLTRMADVAFVFSGPMLRRRSGLNPRTHVVLPAGDVEHYTKATLPETDVPEDLAKLPRPIIGAICVVDPERFDAPLLVHMAERHPEWSIVILGPVRRGVDLSVVKAYANIHIMDNRPLETMPSYLKGMDVAIVPYALNDATRDIYPMKMQEYLAGGKPVVSPLLPVCEHLSDVVYFSDSHADFVANVSRALEEDSPERIAERRAVAARNSWRNRLEERSRHILAFLDERAAKQKRD